MKLGLLTLLSVLLLSQAGIAQNVIPRDTIPTPHGRLIVYFIGHGSLTFLYQDITIHVDPWSKLTDYVDTPSPDIILLTHHHPDHLDTSVINKLRKPKTEIFVTKTIYDIFKVGKILSNYDTAVADGIGIQAVPAYNTTSGRDKYHPKGRDNGYILTIDGKRIYIAGDTENIPEMNSFGPVDIAFLPMNQPYTMLPEQLADAAKIIKPKILYPYHMGETDTSGLRDLLRGSEIELRIRPMK